MTFTWTALPGVSLYGFEFTGANRTFANLNGAAPDGVNGFGGAGGGFPVTGTTFPALLTPGFPQGTYQVRVIGLTPAGVPTGTFSDAVTLILEPGGAAGAAGRVTVTAPPVGSPLVRGTSATFAWSALAGVAQYFFEFTGPSRVFANPNGTTPDPGAGGGLPVTGTNFTAAIPPIAPGSYQIRVIGLGPTGQFLGTFSDAVTVVVQ